MTGLWRSPEKLSHPVTNELTVLTDEYTRDRRANARRACSEDRRATRRHARDGLVEHGSPNPGADGRGERRAGGRRRAECVGGRIGAWAGDSVRGGRAGERFGNSRRKHILPEKDGSPL
jgi:hypothetical protein